MYCNTMIKTQLTLRQRVGEYGKLMRVHKPIGILLLLWPTLWALWIASDGYPNSDIVFIFVLGTVIMRSAGCLINDFADRHFDGAVERTRQRPLAAKTIHPAEAIALFVVLGLCGLFLVFLLNPLCLKLAVVGMVVTMIYPFLKRYIAIPQLGLGVAYSWGVPMAFAAQTGQVPVLSWVLFAIAFLWPLAYDTMYAMVDRADDLKIGIKSSAIYFGNKDRLAVAIIQSVMLVALAVLGFFLQLHWPYFVGLLVAVVLSIYQLNLIKHRQAHQCFKAFLNNNWLGLAVFLGLAVSYWL